jgi:hypothetical protein
MKMVSSFSQRRQSWLAAALNNSASRSGELGWVDFHLMRRTHATLMNDLHDDPKLVADQTVSVSQILFTQ